MVHGIFHALAQRCVAENQTEKERQADERGAPSMKSGLGSVPLQTVTLLLGLKYLVSSPHAALVMHWLNNPTLPL